MALGAAAWYEAIQWVQAHGAGAILIVLAFGIGYWRGRVAR
ncbi:hypothetical protein ACRAVF_19020 [Bradyrhizobium oligotrophicum S58]